MIRAHSVCFISDEITASFRRFGHLFVDWPHKAESKSYFPPKGLWRRHQSVLCPQCLMSKLLIQTKTKKQILVSTQKGRHVCYVLPLCLCSLLFSLGFYTKHFVTTLMLVCLERLLGSICDCRTPLSDLQSNVLDVTVSTVHPRQHE